MVSSKHAFWQALVIALAVFGIGIVAGFFLESYRADTVKLTLLDSEIRVLDEQLRDRVIEQGNVSCALAQESLFDFADRIYQEAQKLEAYDSSSKFSGSFLILHRRYDLLRTLLWQDSVRLSARCQSSFHTVVYLYEYNPDGVEMRARQSYYSRMLGEIKEQYGKQVLLIPVATNMNLSSVDMLLAAHDVHTSPVIFIDDQYVVSTLITRDELERIIFFSRHDI